MTPSPLTPKRPTWLKQLPPLTSSIVPFVIGLALLSAGAFWAWPPAGLIAPGLVLLYVALAGDTERTT